MPSCDRAFVDRLQTPDGRLWEIYGIDNTNLFQVEVARPSVTPPGQVVADRGYCSLLPPTNSEVLQPTVQANSISNIGIPLPLLFVGCIALIASGLNGIKSRKIERDWQTERDAAYAIVPRTNLYSENPRIQPPDLSVPRIQDDGCPTWEDGWPKMQQVYPTPPPPPIYPTPSDTLDAPGVSGVSTPSDTPGTTPGDTPSDTPRINPLSLCPFDIKNPPCEGEKLAVEWLIYQDTPQNELIKQVWGLVKNGREGSPYQMARARYQGYLEAWKEKYALN